MNVSEVLESLDAEITRLQHARSLIAGSPQSSVTTKRRGRPPGSKSIKPATSGAIAKKLSKKSAAKKASKKSVKKATTSAKSVKTQLS